jgi:hypothetical protein
MPKFNYGHRSAPSGSSGKGFKHDQNKVKSTSMAKKPVNVITTTMKKGGTKAK